MSSHSSYRNGASSHSYYSSHSSTSPSDSGQIYGSTRDMLPPPPMDFPPPRPMEIDLSSSNLNSSRTLPSPSASAPTAWGDSALFGSHSFDNQFGSTNVTKSHQPAEGSIRTSQQDPLVQWYSANDGPWVPKQIMDTSSDERLNLRYPGNRIPHLYGNQYRQPSHTDGGSFHYPVPHSDSGYGTRHSVGNTSVFSGDVNERDQDSHSLLGPSTDYQSYQGYNDQLQMQSHDGRTSDSWATPVPGVSPPTSSSLSSLTCPTCCKPVKTQSELKKHDLRHRKPFVCKVEGCKRVGGFSTTNDLDRHTKSKHPTALSELASTKRFRCLVPGCKSKDKSWPRLDNFRSHLKRVHIQSFASVEEHENMIRSGEYTETTSLEIEQDPLAQGVPHEQSQAEKPAASDDGSRQDWRTPRVEDLRPSHGSIPSIGSVLDVPVYRTSSQLERSSYPELQRQETVKPVEVFPRQVSTNRTSTSPSLDSIILNPADLIDPALTSSNIRAQKASSIGGKVESSAESSASNATIVEVVKTALAAVNNAEATSDASHRYNRERNDLPNGRTSITSSPNDPNPAMHGNAAGLRNPGDRSGSSSSKMDLNDSEARRNAQALEVLKIISRLGFTLQKDPSHPVKAQEAPSAAVPTTKSDKKVTCPTCKNFTGRPCELKKHMKRHSKPYGCTFANCPKTFGSKNDWKRHENSQHFHQETLRCDIEKLEGGACGKAFYRRQTFQEHLKNQHGMKEESSIKGKLESCRIGRNCQVRFWCGFCNNMVDLKKKGLEAWTERFDHIDHHFMGKNGFEAKNIRDWMYVNSDKPRGEMDSPPSSGLDKESPDGSDHGSASSPEATGRTPADAIILDPVDGGALKRKRGSDEEDTRPSKPRKRQIVCCQCDSPHNPRFNVSCNTCDDSHVFCEGCKEQFVDEES